MKKRFISLVVLLAMGTIFVSSCGQGSNKPGDVTTNDNSSETTAPADDDPFEKDSLPELNFNGETINVLYREDVPRLLLRRRADRRNRRRRCLQSRPRHRRPNRSHNHPDNHGGNR